MPAEKLPRPNHASNSLAAPPAKAPDLWRQVRSRHPELAMAMCVAKQQTDAWVMIDPLPLETKRWLWHAIQRWHPGLAKLLSEGPLAEMKATFGGSTYTLKISDVVRVLEAQFESETPPEPPISDEPSQSGHRHPSQRRL
ncbi:MAG: hypothetical protein ACR2PS_08740 [Pseudomonadales bacterium]